MIDHLRRNILGCAHRAVDTSGSWRSLLGSCLSNHEVSDGYCDVFLVLCTKRAVTLHRKRDVRRVWALTPRVCGFCRAAWPYTVCAGEWGLCTGIWLSGIPSSSLICFTFLLPHFRLTLEFPPSQIRFSQNREVFVKPPCNSIAFQQQFSSPYRIRVGVLPHSCSLSLLCCMALFAPHLACCLLWHGPREICNKKKN